LSYQYFQLVDQGTGEVLLLTTNGPYVPNSRFFLWSDFGNLVWRATSTGTSHRFITRWALFDDTVLPEFPQRLAIKQSLAAGASYDLIPPAGEVWFVDFHNWFGANKNLLWNGTTLVSPTVAGSTFRVSSSNWMRFKNAGGSAMTLLISGVKGVE